MSFSHETVFGLESNSKCDTLAVRRQIFQNIGGNVNATVPDGHAWIVVQTYLAMLKGKFLLVTEYPKSESFQLFQSSYSVNSLLWG